MFGFIKKILQRFGLVATEAPKVSTSVPVKVTVEVIEAASEVAKGEKTIKEAAIDAAKDIAKAELLDIVERHRRQAENERNKRIF